MDGDDVIYETHKYLQFLAETEDHRRLRRFVDRKMTNPISINWDLLRDVGEIERAEGIIGVGTPWRHLIDLASLP